MKIPEKMNPKNLFKSKKSVSRSHSSSSNSSSSKTGFTTPTSVLHDSDTSNKLQYDLLQAFQIIDTDKDGKISRFELESLLLKIVGSGSGSEAEINLMINEIDSKGDGNIDLTEFGLISAEPLSEGELKGAFEFFDNDGDGTIKADELFHVFKAIGDRECTLEDCKRMIRNVDKNGDGFVCFEDFTLMMDMHQQQQNHS